MAAMDQESFIEQIHLYAPGMYRLALSILHQKADAEDAVSEAVLKAYENLASLRKQEAFHSWIMQITANEAKKLYRQSKRQTCMENREPVSSAVSDTYGELWQAVQGLKACYREVIILFYYEQFSIKEIGKILKLSEGTVKSRLFRAKKLLKESL